MDWVAVMTRCVHRLDPTAASTKVNRVLPACQPTAVTYVKDRSNTPKGCDAMYVEDVKDRSNTPKGCNAMYVKDGKRT